VRWVTYAVTDGEVELPDLPPNSPSAALLRLIDLWSWLSRSAADRPSVLWKPNAQPAVGRRDLSRSRRIENKLQRQWHELMP
jgi:hypothetical protein